MVEVRRTAERIEAGIAQGLHPGAQLHVSRGNEVLVDAAFGEARPGVAMTPETLTLWMSSCKPLTAVAAAQQWEAGRLDLDAPVATYIPEFAQGAKEAITLRHLLTHTGGFRATRFNYPEDDWATIIAKICATPADRNWIPGQRAGYHLHSSWFILGAIVERVAGAPYSEHLRRALLEPAGMLDSWIGMPASRYATYRERLSVVMDTAKEPPAPLGWHEPAWVTHARPSGNGYGPARELARFYRMLLRGGTAPGGARILRADTVQLWTSRQREGMRDDTFRTVLDWGLGFILDSKRHGSVELPYGYGPHASDRSFGHSGYQSSVAFADPQHDLAVALVFNGCPGDAAHQSRVHETLAALYVDLGLA